MATETLCKDCKGEGYLDKPYGKPCPTCTGPMETLHCQVCDNDFTRKRVRGRKPKTCPPCKAQEQEATPVRTRRSSAEPITNSRESFQAKIDSGLSLYCSHPNDLGKLCEREQAMCNCSCHTREAT